MIGDNGRVGGLTYTGNQSINGLVQRLDLPRLVWFAAALLIFLAFRYQPAPAQQAGTPVAPPT